MTRSSANRFMAEDTLTVHISEAIAIGLGCAYGDFSSGTSELQHISISANSTESTFP